MDKADKKIMCELIEFTSEYNPFYTDNKATHWQHNNEQQFITTKGLLNRFLRKNKNDKAGK